MPHDDPSQPDTESLIAANAAFYDTFEALDMEGMARLWEESDRIFCVHPGWQALRGRKSVLESWEVILANTTRIKFTLTGVEARVEGRLGIVILHENIISQVGKERHSAAAVSTNLFTRDDGGWKLIHHHASLTAMDDEDHGPIN